ncbi:MAG: TCP-1/cpn60 chaperonin family protein, partial [Patescibacteria group bacterium]
LCGGVAVIKGGAATDTETKAKKARIEAALHATNAAVEEGVVLGGGLALAVAGDAFKELTDKKKDNPGAQIVDSAILEPIKQIVYNAGKDGSLILYNIIVHHQKGSTNIGYNAVNGKFEDLMAAGIVDPTKVTRLALQNAASAAAMFLTTEAVVADKPEPKEHNHGNPGMGGGMGDMM